MHYEIYEVVKQYRFEVEGVGQVKAEIIKTIKPEMNHPYMWRCSHMHDGYAPNHGNSQEVAEDELIYYIKSFEGASVSIDPTF